MKYRDLFIKPKPVMAMVHLKGDSCDSVQERARREIVTYQTTSGKKQGGRKNDRQNE